MEVNKANLTKGFLSYVEAKRKQALYLKLFFVSATFIVLAVSVLFIFDCETRQ